jgi:DNA-binding NtrC family response regulator
LVLVADDDELVRWCAAERLREQGYSVAVAASAREALRGGRDAAVALLDADLPDVDGLAVAEHLRRRQPRCAVVLMTADPTPELRRRAREMGVARVLEKPFSLEDLVEGIHEALEHTPGAPRPRPNPPAEHDEGGEGAWRTEAPRGH